MKGTTIFDNSDFLLDLNIARRLSLIYGDEHINFNRDIRWKEITTEFINYFLKDYIAGEKLWSLYYIQQIIKNITDETIIITAIKKLKYENFLKTVYWKSIAHSIKGMAFDRICHFCGYERISCVHHKTYKHHGEEHNHPEDLVPLCNFCHKFEHSRLDNRKSQLRIYTKSQNLKSDVSNTEEKNERTLERN